MSEKIWVDDNHYRTVADDGRSSVLTEVTGFFGQIHTPIEVADHHSDGTTTAYEADNGFWASSFNGSRGDKK